MELKFAEYVVEYLIDKLCGKVYGDHLKKHDKLELEKEIKDIKLWINEFIERNETSIIATGEFDNYLCHNAILDTMLEYVTKPEKSANGEEDFLIKIINNFKGTRQLSVNDSMIVKELFRGLLSRIKDIYYNKVPDHMKILLYAIFQIHLELNEVHRILQRLSELNTNSVEQKIIYDPNQVYSNKWEEKDNTYIDEEAQKYRLSWLAEHAIQKENYLDAAELKYKIAQICRKQGKERDAYLLEHSAFELQERQVYRLAQADLSFFDPEDIPPNVEILKTALTELARQSESNNRHDLFAFYTEIGLRICQAQHKEQDVYLMQTEFEKYRHCLPLANDLKQEAYALIKRTYYVQSGFNAQNNDRDENKANYFFQKAVVAGWDGGSQYK